MMNNVQDLLQSVHNLPFSPYHLPCSFFTYSLLFPKWTIDRQLSCTHPVFLCLQGTALMISHNLFLFHFFVCFKLLAAPCGTWNLISLTRDRIHASCIDSTRMLTTGPQGRPLVPFCISNYIQFLKINFKINLIFNHIRHKEFRQKSKRADIDKC